jgi:hypothetical protein
MNEIDTTCAEQFIVIVIIRTIMATIVGPSIKAIGAKVLVIINRWSIRVSNCSLIMVAYANAIGYSMGDGPLSFLLISLKYQPFSIQSA